MSDWLRLDGRRALVTGSARGLGLEIARGLALQGATVFLNGRDPAALEDARVKLTEEGLTVEAASFDVTDGDAVGEALAAIVPDVLVNNVGHRDRRGIAELTSDDLGTLLETDLVAAFGRRPPVRAGPCVGGGSRGGSSTFPRCWGSWGGPKTSPTRPPRPPSTG